MTDWPLKTLGEICELISRGRPPSYCEDGGVLVLNQRCIRNGQVNYGPVRRTDSVQKPIPDWAYLRIGDTLVNSTGAGTLGRASFVSELIEPTTFDTHLTVVRPKVDVCWPAYVGLVLNSREQDIVDLAGGATGQTELPREAVRAFEIPVPPLEEQKRIVALLDAATARVSELTACYERARTHANNLFSSALRDALENNPTWPIKTLGEVAKWGSGGTPQSGVAKYYGGDIPWCVIGDLTEGDVWETERSITKEGLLNSSAKITEIGAVLIAMYGASIGRTGVVRTRMATNQAIAFAYANETIVYSDYFLMFLQSQKQRFVNAGQGAAQPNISQLVLKEWPIPVPPLEEQKRIVANLDLMRAKTSEMVAAYDVKLTAAKNLRQSILEAAFAGDL